MKPTNIFLRKTVFILFLLGQVALHAQVSIGSTTKPSEAALLDIKNIEVSNPTAVTDDSNVSSDKGGFLLPRVKLVNENTLEPFLTVAEMTTAEKIKHTGLMVYNLETSPPFIQAIYIWNGGRWMAMNENPLNANNGLTASNILKIVELGGTLTQSTTINQDGKQMLINTLGATLNIDGNLKVGSDKGLTVSKDGHVGINNPAPDYLLDFKSDGIPGQYVSAFRLADGSHSAGRILKSKSDGTGEWITPIGVGYNTIDYTHNASAPAFWINQGNYFYNFPSSDNSALKLIFPSKGVYLINIHAYLDFAKWSGAHVALDEPERILVRIVPTGTAQTANTLFSTMDPTISYRGAYQYVVYKAHADRMDGVFVFDLVQTIIVDDNMLEANILLSIGSNAPNNTIYLRAGLGQSSSMNIQTASRSYLKIK